MKITDEEICHLSRVFNENAHLGVTRDYNINEWLKEQIIAVRSTSPSVAVPEETLIAIKDEARREMATIAANCEIKFSPARSGQLADQIELARGGIAKAILNTIGQP